MKSYCISLLILIVVIGCHSNSSDQLDSNQDTESRNLKDDFPYLEVKVFNDTLNYGEVINGLIELSDTSFFEIEINDSITHVIKPIITVNGVVLPLNKSSQGILSIQVDSLFPGENSPGLKYLECRVMFPCPNRMGDVILQRASRILILE